MCVCLHIAKFFIASMNNWCELRRKIKILQEFGNLQKEISDMKNNLGSIKISDLNETLVVNSADDFARDKDFYSVSKYVNVKII